MTLKKRRKMYFFTAEPAENTESRKNHLAHLSALRALGGKQIQDKHLLHDEDAQSTVIGFVLIIGILIATSSIYFAAQLPEWTGVYESLHAAAVADDFSELKALIDGIVLKKGESELAGGVIPIKMAPDKVLIFGMSSPGSNLIFSPQAEKFELVVPAEGGGSGTETWVQNTTSDFNAAIKQINVDTASDRVKLSKFTPEGNLGLGVDEINEIRVLDGEHNFDQVVIKNHSTLYVSPATGTLKIYANSITVESGSKIIADYVGFSGGEGAVENGEDGVGLGAGKGGAGGTKGKGGGGAGYGGNGGAGAGDGGGAGGITYGSLTIEMGSGGGAGGTGHSGGGSGGSGGGAILLDAEQINFAGTISANGEDGLSGSHSNDGAGSGGSGGGIMIRGKDVTISGTAILSATGGAGGNGNTGGGTGGGGGAGGRIKIFYESGSVNILERAADSGVDAIGVAGGTGGESGVYVYEEEYTTSIMQHTFGYLTSAVHDTTSDSTCYGEMTWDATLNDQTFVMKVRTDMFEDMPPSLDWENYPAVSNGSDISDLSSVSDGHRYVQYRAELYTDSLAETPVLHEVKINYSFSGQSPTLAMSSGSIKFKTNYLYYPNQEIVYEHGAVIKYQSEGGFMLQPPSIDITKDEESGIPKIGISTVDLTGANCSYSGSTTTSVKNRFKSYNLLADGLKYPNLTINVTTDYPSVWGNWFNKTFEESGLDNSYFDVNVTDANVEVKFYGKGDGVELYFEKTVVEVEI